MPTHSYIILADQPTRDPDAVRIVGYWSDALAALAAAVRTDGAVMAELRAFPSGAILGRHDGTGYDFTPAERTGPCGAVYRRVMDEAAMTCRRAAGHPGFCRADGQTSDAG